MGGQHHALADLPTKWPGGGPQGRSGRVRKISLPPRFDPRTVQPVASRCTNCTKPEEKRPIGRHVHRRDDNIRIGVQGIGLWGVEGIEVAQEEWPNGGVL